MDLVAVWEGEKTGFEGGVEMPETQMAPSGWSGHGPSPQINWINFVVDTLELNNGFV